MAAEVVPRALAVAGVAEAAGIVATAVELVERANFAEERAVGVVGTAWNTSLLALLDRESDLSTQSSQCLTTRRTFK